MTEEERNGYPPEAGEKFKEYLMRDYRPEDKEALLAMYNLLSSTQEGRESLRYYFVDPVSRSEFEAHLGNTVDRHRTVILSPEGTLIGLGKYYVDSVDPERAELARLILPEHQGKGIGTALIMLLIKKCRQLNPDVTRMESQTYPDNEAAVRSLDKAIEALDGFKAQPPGATRIHYTFPIKRND
jgi:RimJ/RimL family protein N-acetyltransferase